MVNDNKQKDENKVYKALEESVNNILSIRKKPLLLMFYSDPAGTILPYDIEILEEVFENYLKKNNIEKIKELDLVIQTTGGDADTSYRLIQLIRSYCDSLTIFVPTHAYSGGSLMCFGANQIHLGRSATLSPVDVQLGERRFALLSVEKYVDFIDDCAKKLNIKDEENKTDYLIELTKKLVEEVPPTTLGELFRMRTLTELHARTLLYKYMFKHDSEKVNYANKIVAKFTQETPTHSFDMDYQLVKSSGLKVKIMDSKIYKELKTLIRVCTLLKRVGYICPFYHNSDKQRIPHFNIFGLQKEKKQEEKKNAKK